MKYLTKNHVSLCEDYSILPDVLLQNWRFSHLWCWFEASWQLMNTSG